ncbi:alpha/beta hydrolase [Mycetocola zhadangensis]|uniref:Alpha/beta hydrolase n=2 Tax=Mycetocola zhadangensis TaxID=1164595 RepID=A0A3L7IZ20_9MICO|nr:alpha/beta hydrolase [Mycetocola zhadangensis]
MTMSGCVTAFFPETEPAVVATSTPNDEDVAANLKDFYSQNLSWSNCEGQFQCATVVAPMNWDSPESGDVELSLIRQRASGDAIGSLLVNPGGPGASGYEFVRDSVDFATDSRLQENFDIVGFDPRGVGRSTPVTCLDENDMDDYLYGLSTAERGSEEWMAELASSAKEYGNACAENTGASLEYINTVSAARDLDLMRAVLGDAELYYLGYSYGTFLGATYAELYPEKAGRLVLDGAIDPSTSNFEVNLTQAKGFESALRAYLDDCIGTPECPFKGSVDNAMTTIGDLMTSVDSSPIKNSDGRQLGASSLLTAIIYPLYSPESGWPLLSEMFVDVMSGSAAYAFSFADAYNGRNEDGSYSDNSTEAFSAYNCRDYTYDDDPARMAAEAAELAAAAPTIGPFFGYGDIGCANWPHPDGAEREKIAAAGAPPILVVGTTNDPATPYVWAEALAEQLESGVLVTYEGEGHTGYNKGSECVNSAVDDYLISGTVPSEDPQCS